MEWDNLLIWEFSSLPQLKSKHHIRQSVKIIEIETDGINYNTMKWFGVALHFGLDYHEIARNISTLQYAQGEKSHLVFVEMLSL